MKYHCFFFGQRDSGLTDSLILDAFLIYYKLSDDIHKFGLPLMGVKHRGTNRGF